MVSWSLPFQEGESFSSVVTSDSSDNGGSERKPETKIPGKRKQSLKQQNTKKQEDKQVRQYDIHWNKVIK